MELVWPSKQHLNSYVSALNRGWSPDNIHTEAARIRELEMISKDPQFFLTRLVDIEAKGQPIKLPDGREFQRIPGYKRWMWDGEFCGSISFRWQPNTSELPSHVLGHIGYATVPWKQNQGYATLALKLLLPDAKSRGLEYVDITTDSDNIPSQRVIISNGGILIDHIKKPDFHGGSDSLLYRIDLTGFLSG